MAGERLGAVRDWTGHSRERRPRVGDGIRQEVKLLGNGWPLAFLGLTACYLGDAHAPAGAAITHGAPVDVVPQTLSVLRSAGYRCAWIVGTGEHLECASTNGSFTPFLVMFVETPGGQELALTTPLPWKVPNRCAEHSPIIDERINTGRRDVFAWCSPTHLVFASTLLIPDGGLSQAELTRFVQWRQREIAILVGVGDFGEQLR